MTKLGFVLASMLVFLSGNALAEESKELGVYIAGAAGWTKWDDDNNIIRDYCCVDDKDTAYQISAGYKFNRYFALDARYNWLGKYAVDTDSVDFEGWSINGVGILPLGNNGWELFGQLGLGRVDASSRSNFSAKESLWTLGGGVSYNLNRHLSLLGQIDVYSFNLNNTRGSGTVRNYIGAFTLGVKYIFE